MTFSETHLERNKQGAALPWEHDRLDPARNVAAQGALGAQELT